MQRTEIIVDLAENTEGYEDLFKVDKDIFENFLRNFSNVWGAEARKTLRPLKIGYFIDSQGQKCMKFIYSLYGTERWLHVKNETTWY